MSLLSVIPMPWRLAALAAVVVALSGGGFIYGARYELNRQKAEGHDELVAQLVSSQKRVKEDNERNLAFARQSAVNEVTARGLQEKLRKALAAQKSAAICNDSPEINGSLKDIIAESNRSME